VVPVSNAVVGIDLADAKQMVVVCDHDSTCCCPSTGTPRPPAGFFTRALRHGPAPVEVTTDKAGQDLRLIDELVPASAHLTEQYANNPVESDHARLKARVRPMRGLKQFRSAARIAAGHAFVQNLRRATTNSPPKSRRSCAWRQHSPSSRSRYDQRCFQTPRLPVRPDATDPSRRSRTQRHERMSRIDVVRPVRLPGARPSMSWYGAPDRIA
jgi:hypothetical protein